MGLGLAPFPLPGLRRGHTATLPLLFADVIPTKSHQSPVTLPRRTVIEALGKVKAVCSPPSTVVAAGGPSGSAWLFEPSSLHTYCSLPKVVIVTGPENDDGRLRGVSNAMRTAWALSWSRLTSIRDQLPSGRWTAYDVTSKFS